MQNSKYLIASFAWNNNNLQYILADKIVSLELEGALFNSEGTIYS